MIEPWLQDRFLNLSDFAVFKIIIVKMDKDRKNKNKKANDHMVRNKSDFTSKEVTFSEHK